MRGLNILLADDNRNFIDAFKFILGNIESETIIDKILTAYNGKECLEKVMNEEVDLVFIDADMPEMDGAETTKKIVKYNRSIKVVAVSFHNELEYIRKMIGAGAINYIRKDSLSVDIILKELKNTRKI